MLAHIVLLAWNNGFPSWFMHGMFKHVACSYEQLMQVCIIALMRFEICMIRTCSCKARDINAFHYLRM